jgi:hypothetical protein
MAHDVRNIYTHARMAITSNLIQLPQPDAAPSHPAIVSERPADGLSQNRQIPWEVRPGNLLPILYINHTTNGMVVSPSGIQALWIACGASVGLKVIHCAEN